MSLCWSFSFALFLMVFSATSHADPVAQRLGAVIDPQIRSGKSIGVAVGVLDANGPRFYSFGQTRRGSETRPTADTLFEIGSITKTFTALLLGDAVIRQEAKLTERVEAFIPELKNHFSGSITLEQLVTHSSGLPLLPCNLKATGGSYLDYNESDLLSGLTDSVLLRTECDVGPHPSEKIVYSNWGTALLGYVLARARHLTYPELVAQRIAIPLSLKDTVTSPSLEQRARMAQGYDNRGRETPFRDRKIMFGNGALLTTARDFFEYLNAQLSRAATSLSQAIALSHLPRFYDEHSIIGLGWFIWNSDSADSGLHVFSHEGAMDGFTSNFYFDTRAQRGFFYLANSAFRPECIQAAIEGTACGL